MVPTAEILLGSFGQKLGNVSIFLSFLVVSAVLYVWAYREWRHRGRSALAVLSTGGTIAILGDGAARALLWLRPPPEVNHPVVYRAFEVDVGPWMMTAFAPYIAGAGYIAYLALDRRWPRRRFWLLTLALIAADALGELFWINAVDLYVYDKPPLAVFGLSLVWPFAYMVSGSVAGAMVFFFGRNLHGARKLILLPIPAGAFPALLVLCGWPALLAMHSAVDGVLLSLAGAVAIASMLALLYALTTQMGEPREAGDAAPAAAVPASPPEPAVTAGR